MKRALSFLAGISFMAVSAPTFAQGLSTDINWNNCQGLAPQEAITGCTAVITSGAESLLALANAFTFRGNAYLRAGDPERAAADYLQAARYDDQKLEPVLGYGLSLYAQRRLPEALNVLNLAVSRNPRYAEAIYARGLVKRAMGANEEANDDFSEARTVSAGVTRSLANLGIQL
jgi:tetratricopeptide (TPR) repeat protein